MADQKIRKLARNLSQVKQISSDVNLNTYYSEIKPFLFGTGSTTPIKKTNLSGMGGIYSIAKSGKMTSGTVVIKVNGRASSQYKIANVTNTGFISDLQPDENGHKNKNASEYFFPSDLVRVLTGLAHVFYNSKYNVGELTPFASGSSNHQSLVKKWSQANTAPELLKIDLGYFYEEKIETLHTGSVKKLLNAVVNAAIEFENVNEKINLKQFDPISEIRKKITKEIVPKIFDKFIETLPKKLEKQKEQNNFEKLIKPILDKDQNFIKDKSDNFKEELSRKIESLISNNSLDFFSDLFSSTNLGVFKDQGSYDPEVKYFLFTTRDAFQDKPKQNGIKQTEIYSTFITQAIEKFLEKSEIEEFITDYILPLFKKVEGSGTDEGYGSDEEQGGDVEDIPEEEVKLESPISLAEFKIKLSQEITDQVSLIFLNTYLPNKVANDLDFKKIGKNDWSLYKTKIQDRHLSPVEEDIKLKIKQKILSDFVIEDSEKTELVNKKLFALDKFEKKIFEFDWYKELLSQSVDFIEKLPSSNPEHDLFFDDLYKKWIVPHIKTYQQEGPQLPEDQIDEEAVITTDVTEIDKEPTDPNAAVVPTDIPDRPTQTDKLKVTKDQIHNLTQEERRALQYESAWLYNRAVYEIYTSKGIKLEDIDQQDLLKLQSEIFNHTAGISKQDLNKLFGSASYRQKALLAFYQTTDHGIDVLKSSQELLGETFKKTLNLDSPVLTENIKNTVDSLIIQYGLNQDFYAFDPEKQQVTQYSGTNNKDIIWFIENMPADRLALIFDLQGKLPGNQAEAIKKLREILKNYSRSRASEMSLQTQNTSLQHGLFQISDEDAKKIQEGDKKTISKHLSSTNYIRDMVKHNDGETVVGALDTKPGDDRKQKLQKQYKMFVPLWDQLEDWEQAEVYKKFDLPIPPEFLKNGKFDRNHKNTHKLQFTPEFLFFDITKLGEFKKLAKKHNLNDAQQAELFEIAEIQNQLLREEKLAEKLNNGFNKLTNESEYQEIGGLVGVDYDNTSFRERLSADQMLQEGGEDIYRSYSYDIDKVRPGRGGAIPHFLDSKYGRGLKKRSNKLTDNRLFKKFKKKHSPTAKATQAFKNAAGKGIDKAAAASLNLLPGVGTALSALLLAIPNKNFRNAVSSAIMLGISAFIARTIWAAGSIGGLLGGIIGGAVAGVASGTALIVPGAIAGIHIGEAILPQRWWDFWNKAKQSPVPYQNAGAASAASRGAAAGSKPTTLTQIAMSYEGLSIIAAGGFSIMIVAMTLFIVLIIQSAFLIPIPGDRDFISDRNLPPGQSLCWPTSGHITRVDTIHHKGKYSVNGIIQAIDIVCLAGDTTCIDNSGSNINPPKIYASHDGTATVIDRMGGYGLHVIITSPEGYKTIYAHMSSTIIPSDESKTISRGELLGNMGNTGASIADASGKPSQHLHYEYSGGKIRDILPSSPVIPPSSSVDENGYLPTFPVIVENCSVGGEIKPTKPPTGYIAIGPQSPGNVVTTDSSLVSNPQIPCVWRENTSLDAVINGNFYNAPKTPIGLGGSNPVKYYSNAENRGGPEYMGFAMRAFVIDQSNNASIINIKPDWYNSSLLPIDLNNYLHAVTGLSEYTKDDGDLRGKTAVGLGNANGKCGSQKGPSIFLGAIKSGKWSDLSKLMKYCGATEYVFMDAGGSASFCSDTFNMPSSRTMPINIGLKNAEIMNIK